MTSGFTLQLGKIVPDFACNTTHGSFNLHAYVAGETPYTILMTHPKDYTPVCTTELGKAESLVHAFRKRGVKLLALSGDSIEDHKGWSKDILAREGKSGEMMSYPIIADENLVITTMLGLMDSQDDLPGRGLIVLDKDARVRLALLYPTTVGRNFDEVLRIVDALCLVDTQGIVTPANWQPGDKVILPPNISKEEGEKRFKIVQSEHVHSGKDYMRFVDPKL